MTVCVADPIEPATGAIPAAVEAVLAGTMRPSDLAETSLARALEVERSLQAFCLLDPAHVRALASVADARDHFGPLTGVPIAVKDVFDTAGIPTEAGSLLFKGRVPSVSAAVVLALEGAGAFVFGKTVTAALAYATPGPTVNPWDRKHTPGGSSMGSAAAVAAGIVPAALGTQTTGSLIRPAAFCGVVGFKPSDVLVSTMGVVGLSPTLDQVGCIACDLESAVAVSATLTGTEQAAWGPNGVDLREMRLAAVETSSWRLASSEARRRFMGDLANLEAAGAHIERTVLPPDVDETQNAHGVIVAVEAADLYGEAAARDGDLLDAPTLALIRAGSTAESRSGYTRALGTRAAAIDSFDRWAKRYDAILTPPTVGGAPPLSSRTTGDPSFCQRWTFVGAPAITIPTGFTRDGLPLGLQLVGSLGEDGRLVEATRAVQDAVGVNGGGTDQRLVGSWRVHRG